MANNLRSGPLHVAKTGPGGKGPQMGVPQNKPAARSTSTSVNSSTYQPFPSRKSVAGATGMISASDASPDLGDFKSPMRKALASRRFGGPTKMLGNQASGNGKPSSGGRSSY